MSTQSTADGAIPKSMWNEKGELVRPATVFRNFIANEPGSKFLAERDRYHLYVSYACPWAHRTLIVRKLKGLEEFISVTVVHYHLVLGDSWRFVHPEENLPGADCTPDPLHPGLKHVKELYLKADPAYQGRFSVPVLWDKKLDTIVNNESSEIIWMLGSAFDHFLEARFRDVDLYPTALRPKIDEAHGWMYESINNGVYKCGLSKTQSAYFSAVTSLFEALELVESHLYHNGTPYYFGQEPSEVDVRLYVTIVRFDPVYVSLFKTNKKMIRTGYPSIHRWLQNLYWKVPAFRETTELEHIKKHYFMSLTMINPSGIVPEGPVPDIEPLN